MVNFGLNSASFLAQVNFGGGFSSILGIFLAVAGAALYFLRSVRPELARDHDIFFAAIGLACGVILLFQGWRLDPILQFGQVLLTGATVFFAVESIRLRGVATEQAKRNTRIVDEERPVSSSYSYQAELDDDLEPLEEEYTVPRIQGSRDVRRRRTDEYEDEPPRNYRRNEYDDEPPRQLSNRSSSSERIRQGDKPRRRTRPASRPSERTGDDEWGSTRRSEDDWDASSARETKSPRMDGSSRLENRNDVTPRPKKRRRTQDSSRRESDVEATPTDYVDYKPIDQLDDEPDNSANFDEP